ncbi:ankyrin [Hydrogenophaga taeniospiralis CCUG 15921]|uniref:Ankyrin n=2 Tax=Hydrogenophaga TaxID=47420 RepID=A0A9X4S6T3_9BURK|nr:ankyrin [Hydrogenophaga taeniospiralis CCUG 15921]
MSETTLEDGRVLYIGGEHEDHYDPDFCIYNDVTVVDAAGSIAIHGYPKEDFPPTDFHSATRIGSAIYIVGRLGYAESRTLGVTPVFKLSLDSMQMEAVETLGESPGWIYEHQASLASDGHTLVISGGERWRGEQRATQENVDTWALDTRNGRWTRLTQHHWQHWVMWRVDRKRNRLGDTRHARWHCEHVRRDHALLGLEHVWRHSEPPDFAALDALYRLPGEMSPVIEEAEYGTFSTMIDGLKVRFKESDGFLVEAIVEGQLRPDRLLELQRTTLVLLERIDASPYEIAVASGS